MAKTGRPRQRTLAVIFIVGGTAALVLLRISGWQDNIIVGTTAIVGSVLLVVLARRQRRRLAECQLAGTVFFERLVLSESAATIRQRLDRLVNENRKWAMSDDRGDVVAIETQASLRSFGERIDIRLMEVDKRKTEVHVRSQPTVPTTVVDFGKNRANVERIVRGLRDAET